MQFEHEERNVKFKYSTLVSGKKQQQQQQQQQYHHHHQQHQQVAANGRPLHGPPVLRPSSRDLGTPVGDSLRRRQSRDNLNLASPTSDEVGLLIDC